MSRREQPRMMARRISEEEHHRAWRRGAAALGVTALVVVVGAFGVSTLLGGGGNGPPASPDGAAANSPTQTPRQTVRGGGQGAGQGSGQGQGTNQPDVTATPRPSRSPRTTATPAPTDPQPTPIPGGAPTSPAEFDLRGQVISMGFPLRADARYSYRNNFLDPRPGAPDDYNHSHVREGEVERLHDGIDIYAGLGQPLLAPFDGIVIDPRTRWQPWERERYGRTIVILSEEDASVGYVALFSHAEDVWVEFGAQVTRGQVVGTVGQTGNAESQSFRPHVHFELRAPFLIDWSPLGEERAIDAFNPFPSLAEADPNSD
jgi:murein DD-endopeptidase MepM/ murein hydrolase activator NlpD